MIERLVLGNLRRAQAFDRNLRTAVGVERIATEFVESILFTRDSTRRTRNVERLKRELYEHVRSDVMPQAERIGEQNARDIAAKTPAPDAADVPDDAETIRRRALFAGRQRAAERLAVVRLKIDGEGNTLDNRLARYWLEPGEGGDRQKLERLREIHVTLEKRRKKFDAEMRSYIEGESKTRPAQPNLDFMSRLTNEAKKEIRTQARRTGTDAEVALFRQRGHETLAWVVPNAGEACPDCVLRAGVILSADNWELVGHPGTGQTICGDACYCMLVPAATLKSAPGLAGAARRGIKPVRTSAAMLALFDANRRK